MFIQNSYDNDKVAEYLRIVEERILNPIAVTEIRHYCTATLLLLFAVIDGLGNLLHSNDRATVGERIKGFLDYMGGNYKVHKDKLAGLRNSLVHNAINVESFLSHTEISPDQHLKKVGATGFIFVNTNVMYKDVVNTFKRFRSELLEDTQKMERAANRLIWIEEAVTDVIEPSAVYPSPPAPVQFIQTKRKGSPLG